MALLKQSNQSKRASRPRMHQRFVQITLSTVLIGISLIVVSCMGIASIQQANRKSYNTQLQTSMNEYWLEMRNRMGTDREALQILAEFMQGKSSEEFRRFVVDLQTARQENSFLRMGYYTQEGMQSRVRADGTLEENIPMEALEPEVQQLLYYALQGKKTASQVYYDEEMGLQLIMYAAPVQSDSGQVTGVVAASKDLSAFQKILTQPSVSQNKLDVVWVEQDGRIIAASENTPLAPQGTENFLSQAGVDEQMQVGRKFTGGSLLPVSAVSQKTQHLPCFHRVSFLKLCPIGRKVGIVKISAARASDTDAPASQGQPSDLFHHACGHTDYRVIAAYGLLTENVTAFVDPVSSVIPLFLPGIFKEKSTVCLPAAPRCRKTDKIFPESKIQIHLLPLHTGFAEVLYRNPCFFQLFQRNVFPKISCRLDIEKQKETKPQEPFPHKKTSVCSYSTQAH